MLTNRLGTIRRASRWLRILLIALGVLFVINRISTVESLFHGNTRTLLNVVFQGAAITTKIQVLWLMQVVLNTALYLKVLYHLVRLLGLYSHGEVFTAKNVAQLRQIGLTLAFAPVIWLMVLIGAWVDIVAAQDQWVRVMPSFPGGAILGSCIFLYVSRIMNEGRVLRDEQDLVI